MNDLEKLENLLENGYIVSEMSVDVAGKGVISCEFGGIGNPVEGKVFFIITEDRTAIEKARACCKAPD